MGQSRFASVNHIHFGDALIQSDGEPLVIPTDILEIPTSATDTELVLAPNGTGGVEFRAESGGGGGWALLHTVTLDSPAASIGQLSITGTFKDLRVVAKIRTAQVADTSDLYVQLGTGGSIDTGANYSNAGFYYGSTSGNITNNGDVRTWAGAAAGASSPAGTFSTHVYEFPNAVEATISHGFRGWTEYYGATAHTHTDVRGSWHHVSQDLDSISFHSGSGNLDTGCRLYIYGM